MWEVQEEVEEVGVGVQEDEVVDWAVEEVRVVEEVQVGVQEEAVVEVVVVDEGVEF